MIEHELKYTTDAQQVLLHLNQHNILGVSIVQHYLKQRLGAATVRLRKVTALNAVSHWLTFKSPTFDPTKRIEIEISIDNDCFEDFLSTFDIKHTISKQRYHGVCGGIIDIMEPSGEIIFEIENPPEHYVPPTWCIENVTDKKQYKNEFYGLPQTDSIVE